MSINSWIDGKVLEILQAFGVELPGGNGDTLREIARGWDSMGNDLTKVVQALDRAVDGVDKQGWHGAARDAFEKHWQDQKKTITDVANNFHHVAEGLKEFADEIDKINEEIIDICVQIAEMEVLGAALSAFTGFLSDLVANAAVAAKVTKIMDLVKLFTSAAEKVAALLERFGGMSAEVAATLEKMLVAVARIGGKFAESYATNFVADSGSMVINQALSGQPVTVGEDFRVANREALGTAAFTVGGAELADGAKLTGAVGRVLKGEGRAGSAINGGLGNIAGGLNADLHDEGKDAEGTAWDAGTNAVTGALGNRVGDHLLGKKEGHSLGGEGGGEQGEIIDGAYRNAFRTGLNTGIYEGGSGIESDLQGLEKDYDEAKKGAS
ncbi:MULTISPECIES: WXG100 family type VII secretion target [unclassified Streptomyces]|uniref:WXG100-like domain-containing protein n=1 Tax=unclassified Streptomyces TaxID=2593676 RepID=UPI0003788EAE|nr:MULTISPECIES: WXG100 family type VII secretion target [unclassified Streptomyces]MYT32737.1 WXG100 family type VII secretion target [Streptomyces sp. SID8354]